MDKSVERIFLAICGFLSFRPACNLSWNCPRLRPCAEHGARVGRSSTGQRYAEAEGRPGVDESATGSANFFLVPEHRYDGLPRLPSSRVAADAPAGTCDEPRDLRPPLGRRARPLRLLFMLAVGISMGVSAITSALSAFVVFLVDRPLRGRSAPVTAVTRAGARGWDSRPVAGPHSRPPPLAAERPEQPLGEIGPSSASRRSRALRLLAPVRRSRRAQ